MIRRIEELSMNAFPPEKSIQYDGWILRASPGNMTKRINSVNPLYPSTLPLDEKIEFAEEFFKRYKAPVVFKMTDSALPSHLNDELKNRGYIEKSRTLILTKNLNVNHSKINADLLKDVKIDYSLTPNWLEKFCRVSGKSDSAKRTLDEVLSKIAPMSIYISIDDLACGMGVVDSGYIGIYNICVDKAYRQKGYGLKIMNALLHLGRENGAAHSYLQVEASNMPAVNMYMKLGYEKSHEYWYRVKDMNHED